MLRRHPHTPAHLLIDDAPYFITGAIYGRRRLLRDDGLKADLLLRMRRLFAACAWEFQHWVILDNHYHLLVKSRRGEDLPRIINQLHSRSASAIHQATACEFPVWWNYWDYCLRDEQDYHRHLNYLLYNPVKHGYVADLKDYAFSSFQALFAQMGREELARQFRATADFRSLDLPDDF
jgi:putative transposase